MRFSELHRDNMPHKVRSEYVGFISLLVLCTFNLNVFAQQSNVKIGSLDGETITGSRSILDAIESSGRIGEHRYDGRIVPNRGKISRFTDGDDVAYGSAGNIVGLTGSSSRFGRVPENTFHTKNDFELFILRNEYKRAMELYNSGHTSLKNSQNGPRLVTATPPKKFPDTKKFSPAYGKTRAQLLAEQDVLFGEKLQSSNIYKGSDKNKVGEERIDPARSIWMRGGNSSIPNREGRAQSPNNIEALDNRGLVDYSRYSNYSGANESVLKNGPGGAVQFSNDLGNAWTFSLASRTPAEQYQLFIEELEGQLLSSPEVTPLSPVQVDFQDGVATVRGVVPTPTARMAAGKILLANPEVKRVNNLMTYVRNDDSNRGLVPTQSTIEFDTTEDNKRDNNYKK